MAKNPFCFRPAKALASWRPNLVRVGSKPKRVCLMVAAFSRRKSFSQNRSSATVLFSRIKNLPFVTTPKSGTKPLNKRAPGVSREGKHPYKKERERISSLPVSDRARWALSLIVLQVISLDHCVSEACFQAPDDNLPSLRRRSHSRLQLPSR